VGKGRFGFDLLTDQVVACVRERMGSFEEFSLGESEIEKLFFAALVFRLQFDATEFSSGVLVARDDEHYRGVLDLPEAKWGLIVQPQVRIEKYRVDFVVSAFTFGKLWLKSGVQDGLPRWRRLIVECDGHDFHERTKEQSSRDKSRDRALTTLGYEIFRFTGSELWRDPWGCADQILDWGLRGI
jgi:very-short-patch-repair endonuclease